MKKRQKQLTIVSVSALSVYDLICCSTSLIILVIRDDHRDLRCLGKGVTGKGCTGPKFGIQGTEFIAWMTYTKPKILPQLLDLFDLVKCRVYPLQNQIHTPLFFIYIKINKFSFNFHHILLLPSLGADEFKSSSYFVCGAILIISFVAYLFPFFVFFKSQWFINQCNLWTVLQSMNSQSLMLQSEG